MLDCQKCLDRCKSGCCGVIPFEPEFVKKYKPVREVMKTIDAGQGLVILETDKFCCPYLNPDYSCAVYRHRPEVCQLYGNETHINLTCQWQDKDGRLRSRQERRAVERKITKFMDNFIKYNR